MESFDLKILERIQKQFPISSRPFKELGNEERVFEMVLSLVENGTIRRISSLFNSWMLGFKTTLVAVRVHPTHIDEIANFINTYPQITHNYERDGSYNLWFTVIAKQERLFEIIEEIRKLTGIENLLNLPTIARFKINTIFRISNYPLDIRETIQEKQEFSPDWLDKEIFKHLQNIPLVHKPYLKISKEIGTSEKDLFQKIEGYKRKGVIRSIRAVLDHYKLGLVENCLIVFNVPYNNVSYFVKAIVQYPQVTHCYERLAYPNWQYNIYAVIHSETRKEIEEIILDVIRKTGINEYKKLYTIRELKKSNPIYFD